MRASRLALVAGLVSAILTVSPVAAGRNALRNGSFDRDVSGWTISQAGCGDTPATWYATLDGRDGVVWLNQCGGDPDPSISQTARLRSGKDYRITGFVKSAIGGGDTSLSYFRVRVDGTDQTITVGSMSGSYFQITVDFTPTTTPVTISFVSEVEGDWDYYVDDLVLAPKP